MPKQKNARFYRRILRERKPGQSLADLARDNGIDPNRLYSYLSYLKRSKSSSLDQPSPSAHSPALLPVVLKTPQASTAAFELRLEKLGDLSIPVDFEPQALKRLLNVLRSLSC